MPRGLSYKLLFFFFFKFYFIFKLNITVQVTLTLNSATPISAAVAAAGFACSAWISAPHETQTPAASSYSLTLSAPITSSPNPMA